MLFQNYAFEWLGNVEPKVKRATYLLYRDVIERRLIPVFGAKKLSRIDEREVAEFAAALYVSGNLCTGKGLSHNSAAQIIGLLKRVLESARKDGKIKRNPAEDIERRSGTSGVKAFTEYEQSEIERYVVSCRKPRLYGILISLYTGIRIGELLALKWSDIDLRERTINIAAAQSAVNTAQRFGTPKTAAGKRKIPFPATLLPYFKEMLSQKSEYVIANCRGSYVLIRAYQKSFERILSALNIRRRGFHSLRHTFASRAVEYGADIKTLSEILGHSDPSVTLKRYVHSSDKQKRRVANMVGARLKKYAYYRNMRTFYENEIRDNLICVTRLSMQFFGY